jgi:predicted PurR-regulated permease PerM
MTDGGFEERTDVPGNSPIPPRDCGLFAGKVLIAVLITAGILFLCLLLWAESGIFLLAFGAVLFAIFIRGLSAPLSRALKLPFFVSVIAVILAIGGILYLSFSLLTPHVAAQANELGQKLPDALAHIRNRIQENPLGREILRQMPSFRDLLGGGTLLAEAKGIFSITFGVVIDAFIFFFVSLYLSFDPRVYIKGFLRLVPPEKRQRAAHIFNALAVTLHRWLAGRLLGMALVGLLTGIGLKLVGIPLALTLGLFAALLTFIPYLGAIMSAVPAVLLALLDNPIKVVYVIGLYLLIHTFEAYFVSPMIQQHQVLLPPVIIIIAQILLGVYAGLLGLILATPLTAAAVVIIKMLYIEDVLGEKADVPGGT